MNRVASSLIACAIACVGAPYIPAAEASTETMLYSFQGSPSDGAFPYASLIDVNGTLYGTTVDGGGTGCYNGEGCGTVFSLDPNTGAETVVYSFCSRPSCTDGAHPEASLLAVKGTLYGTTAEGAYDYGTVFSVNSKTGAETVVYPFCSQQNCTDGWDPQAGLIEVKGALYGTTDYGGSPSGGTVFALDPETGAETVLHSFRGGADGALPETSLIDVRGTLYGTTSHGGTDGVGTVFSVNPHTGAETAVYSLGGTEGDYPEAGLIEVKGTLYGTTSEGGTWGGGAVFAIDLKTGAEIVVYSFCNRRNCTDGESPAASLIDVKGKLYSTTESGGNRTGTGCDAYYGCGTVFSLKP